MEIPFTNSWMHTLQQISPRALSQNGLGCHDGCYLKATCSGSGALDQIQQYFATSWHAKSAVSRKWFLTQRHPCSETEWFCKGSIVIFSTIIFQETKVSSVTQGIFAAELLRYPNDLATQLSYWLSASRAFARMSIWDSWSPTTRTIKWLAPAST